MSNINKVHAKTFLELQLSSSGGDTVLSVTESKSYCQRQDSDGTTEARRMAESRCLVDDVVDGSSSTPFQLLLRLA